MKLFTEENAIKILEEFTQDVKDIGKKINERFALRLSNLLNFSTQKQIMESSIRVSPA